jgi:hypothetical protein
LASCGRPDTLKDLTAGSIASGGTTAIGAGLPVLGQLMNDEDRQILLKYFAGNMV